MSNQGREDELPHSGDLKKAFVTILQAVLSLQCFGGKEHSGRQGISCPKEVLSQHLAGKRYLLKTMAAAPHPPPRLHNGWPRNGLPPSSGKEAFLPMAQCSDPCYFLGIGALGLAWMPGRVRRVGPSGGSSTHWLSVLYPRQCPMSMAAFAYDGTVG